MYVKEKDIGNSDHCQIAFFQPSLNCGMDISLLSLLRHDHLNHY